MNQKLIARYHLLGWLLLFCYNLLGVYFFPKTPVEQAFSFHLALLQMSYVLSLMAVFYYCYCFLFPLLFDGKKRFVFFVALCITPFVFVISRYLLEEILFPFILGFRNYGPGTSIRFYLFDNIYRGLPAIAISGTVWALRRAYNKEQENKQLREANIYAEMAFLKSQVNPHFLYNTLNYIYSLAYPVSEKLGHAVINLSALMRYMLKGSGNHYVRIEEEIEYLENYLALYRLRYEDQLFVNFKKEVPDPAACIPSLVLIPFVENALKHGVVNDPAAPVTIHLTMADQLVSFTVTNRINTSEKDHSGGIGLNNIRRRLDLIFPNKHQLVVTATESIYTIELVIPLTGKKNSHL